MHTYRTKTNELLKPKWLRKGKVQPDGISVQCSNADRSVDAVRFEGYKWETIDLSACEAPDNVKLRKLLPGSIITERVETEIETDPWRPLAKNLAALAVKSCLNADRSVDAVRFEGHKWKTMRNDEQVENGLMN